MSGVSKMAELRTWQPARLSARSLTSRYCSNLNWTTVMSLAYEVGALGINVAHSGTVIGMLFDDDVDLTEYAVSYIGDRLLGVRQVYNRRIVNGGWRPAEEPVRWQP